MFAEPAPFAAIKTPYILSLPPCITDVNALQSMNSCSCMVAILRKLVSRDQLTRHLVWPSRPMSMSLMKAAMRHSGAHTSQSKQSLLGKSCSEQVWGALAIGDSYSRRGSVWHHNTHMASQVAFTCISVSTTALLPA